MGQLMINKKWKKLPIVSKESLESDMIDFDDGYESKPLSNEMEKNIKEGTIRWREGPSKKEGVDNCFAN
jgi:hypothetical protein